jgi:phosphohistidine phosphatase SixA
MMLFSTFDTTLVMMTDDVELFCAGRQQVIRVAQQLKNSGISISKILCSPLVRCVQTADLVRTCVFMYLLIDG